MELSQYIRLTIQASTLFIMIPIDVFLVYHVAIHYEFLFNAYFVTMTLYVVNGTVYFSCTFFGNLLEFADFLRWGHRFYQYFIPLLSVMMAINRFTAIVIMPGKGFAKWTFFAVNLAFIFFISLTLLLFNYVGIFGINLSEYETYSKYFDRVFKAGAYVFSFMLEVLAITYRKLSKGTQQLDDLDRKLLIQNFYSTIPWLINCVSNQLLQTYRNYIVLIVITNVMSCLGLMAPMVYLFCSK
uniref:Serpentine receptor class gamma n=1 Tax=Panagrellus redivivus TaxID=6233 RepID=A0A7E4VHW3_PANRE